VVDEQHQLIVEHEVTNDPTDHAHLAEMALRAKATLDVAQLEVVADMGYYDGAEVKRCTEAGITTYIPKPITSINQKRGLFTKQDFVYDEVKDSYRCPQGEELTYRYESFELGRQIRYYATPKCLSCPIKHRCTTNQRGRRISRWVDEKLLEEMARRVGAARINAAAATTLRAAVRHHQAGHEPGLFFDEGIAQGGRRDEFDGLELQPQTSHQHHRSKKDDGSSHLKCESRSLWLPSLAPPPAQPAPLPTTDRNHQLARPLGPIQPNFSHALTTG
jgi:hypothetical protein